MVAHVPLLFSSGNPYDSLYHLGLTPPFYVVFLMEIRFLIFFRTHSQGSCWRNILIQRRWGWGGYLGSYMRVCLLEEF